MGLTVHFEVLNQLGTPMMYSETLANQPAAGIAGRIFFRTDSPYGIYRDNGTSWDQIAGSGGGGGVTGSGTATQVAFWSSSSALTSSSSLYWDNVNGRLGIGNSTPGVPLDVHATGTNAQFNGTGTNNAFLVFQNAGASKWQIGNVYSAGSNYFRIYDSVNAVERFTVQNTGSISTTTNIAATGASTGFQGLYNSNTVTIPAATTFGSGGYTYVGYNQFYSQSFGGSATYQNNNIDTAIFGLNRIDFSAAGGTVTMTQATGVRAMSAAAYQVQYGGTNSGTITHLAGQQILGFYRSAGTGTLTVTNAYGLLINNIDDYAAGFTYTNRWGIFQQGSSDNNYFAGKIITGSSTTVSTYQLDVLGTSRIDYTIAGTSVGFLISNAGTKMFSVYGNGKLALGNNTFEYPTIFPVSTISNTIDLNGTFLTFSSNTQNGNTTGSNNGQFNFISGDSGNATSGNINFIYTNKGFAPTSGTCTFAGFYINNTINQTGGANGITRSIYIAPTLTAASDYRGIELSVSSDTIILGRSTGSAGIQLTSTTRGIGSPSMTTTQKNAITSPIAGLIVFDSTLGKLCIYTGSAWQTITSV